MQRMLLFAAAVVLLAASATAASAAPRMPIGFFDDNSFRWSPNVSANLLAAQKASASVLHVTADWSQIAAEEPGVPENGNDPAYVIADLDALVENAARYGLQVMINISGAPAWTNGDKPPNHPPTDLRTLTTFANMLAHRYNGKSGHGFVGRWSVWNEPNLELFLTPQFDDDGNIVSPAAYAKIYRAAYKGIKAGNPLALVAVGETSNRGRNKPVPNISGSVAPATFARLLSEVAPNLPFDAYATHPYPTEPRLGPAQKVAYPNVTMTRITQFGASLQTWFKRRVPIWITEYGLQTKPEVPDARLAVTKAQQATFAKQALEMAAASPYVEMFIWFTIRDSPATWQSGLFQRNGARKPSYAVFASTAKKYAGQTQLVNPGKRPTVKVYVPFIAYHDVVGSKVSSILSVYDGKKKVVVEQKFPRLAGDQSVSFQIDFKPVKGKEYRLVADTSDIHGQHDKRVIILETA